MSKTSTKTTKTNNNMKEENNMNNLTITYIPAVELINNIDNVRKDLTRDEELENSIKAKGLISPLVVVKDEGCYKVIAGNRRLQACINIGLETIPCIIQEMDELSQIETMLCENIIRKGLTAKEEADGFQLMFDLGTPVEKISEKTGFSQSTVRNRMKLSTLDKTRVDKAFDRNASLEDFAKIVEFEDEDDRNRLLDAIGTKNFNNVLQNIKNAKSFADEKTKLESKLTNYTKIKTLQQWKHPMHLVDVDGVEKEVERECERVYYLTTYGSTSGNIEDIEKYSGYYEENDYSMTVYRFLTDEEIKVKEDKDNALAEYQDITEKAKMYVNEITDKFWKLRKDFCLNFHSFKKFKNELDEIKSYSILNGTHVNKYNFLRCYDFMTKEQIDGLTYNEKEDLAENMFTELSTTERDRFVFLSCMYNLEMQTCSIKDRWITDSPKPHTEYLHNEDNKEDIVLYSFLSTLGYEVSDEENQLLFGMHPVYENKEIREYISTHFGQ